MRARIAFIGSLLGAVAMGPTSSHAGADARHDHGRAVAGRVGEAQLALGTALIDSLAAKAPQGNVVISPASVALTLAALEPAASDALRRSIVKALGFHDAGSQGPDSLGEVKRAATLALARGADGPLAVANLLVVSPALHPHPPVLSAIAAAGVEVVQEDLNQPDALARINLWVSEHTRKLMPSVLDQSQKELGLVAVNAIHFKDRWKAPFDPAETKQQDFHPLDADARPVPMMHAGDRKFAFQRDERFVAVELMFQTDYRLVVITTLDRPVPASEFKPVTGWLGGSGFAPGDGELALPRFSCSSSADLLDAMDAMGLAEARKRPDALARLVAVPQTISQIIQRTELKVDEEGAEAAAATAVTTTRGLPSSDYVKMTVDKPFMFALRDPSSGLILLQGYVGDPGAN